MTSWFLLALALVSVIVCVKSAEDAKSRTVAAMWLVGAVLNLFFLAVRVMEVTA